MRISAPPLVCSDGCRLVVAGRPLSGSGRCSRCGRVTRGWSPPLRRFFLYPFHFVAGGAYWPPSWLRLRGAAPLRSYRAEFETMAEAARPGGFRRWRRIARDAAEEILHCRDEAEDVAQRVLIRAWKSGAWRQIEKPRVYFYVAGRRDAKTLLRSQKRRRARYDKADVSAIMAQSPLGPDKRLMSKECRRQWAEAITTLPPRCQRVCSLVFLEGHTHAEVAARLQITKKAVGKQITRGRKHLRRRLQSDALETSTFLDRGA